MSKLSYLELLYKILFIKLMSLSIFFFILYVSNPVNAQKTYFDLSQDKINIDTNFKGEELILFGLTEPNQDIIVIVRGPKEKLIIRNKKRILGFWFNIDSMTFLDIPKVYFIASKYKISDLLDEKQSFANNIGFKNINFIPKNNKDLFIDHNQWNDSVIRIQKEKKII